MSDFRQNPITGEWVIIAPPRDDRPKPARIEADARPDHDPHCPFCPGNERHTPSELLAYRLDGSGPDAPGWSVRVFPNKFPAVRLDAREPPTPDSIAFAPKTPATAPANPGPLRVEQPAVGQHEVLVESPAHDRALADQPEPQARMILDALRNRFRMLSQARDVRWVSIFKNHGLAAGATLAHPHMQLLATAVVPPAVHARLDRLEAFTKEHGCSLFDVLLEEELAGGRRIIAANDEFVALAPWASIAAYEMWIVPRAAVPFYGELSDESLPLLGTLLCDCLRRLRAVLGDAPHNVLIHSGPRLLRAADHDRCLVRIIPRREGIAGFELSSGMFINAVPPDTAAETLRTS
ncbi:MAG: galactose-1-phosphate uridylyltransferase [Phycisphaerae bacterium]